VILLLVALAWALRRRAGLLFRPAASL